MHKKHLSRFTLAFGPVLFALGFMCFSSPAQAGFQWVAPQATASAPQTYQQQGQGGDQYAGMQTVEIGGDVSSSSSAMPSLQVNTPAPMSVAPAVPNTTSNVVEGFADRVPLSVALRQVLPSEVGFSVAKDVSLNTLVSWEGGRPWQDVLKAMLDPAHLSYSLDGRVIRIAQAGGASVAAAPASGFGQGGGVPQAAVAGDGGWVQNGPTMERKPSSFGDSAGGRPIGLLNAGGDNADAPLSPLAARGRALASYTAPASASMAKPASFGSSSGPSSMGSDAWSASRGQNLRDVLQNWSRRAGVEVNWQAEYDYPIQATVSFVGSYEDAVRNLLSGFQEAQPQPVGFLYNNQEAGQTVLVMRVRGNNYND